MLSPGHDMAGRFLAQHKSSADREQHLQWLKEKRQPLKERLEKLELKHAELQFLQPPHALRCCRRWDRRQLGRHPWRRHMGILGVPTTGDTWPPFLLREEQFWHQMWGVSVLASPAPAGPPGLLGRKSPSTVPVPEGLAQGSLGCHQPS